MKKSYAGGAAAIALLAFFVCLGFIIAGLPFILTALRSAIR